ncbi:MAG: hypothetical protein ACI4PE_04940 [Bacilli bacterium]
MKKICLSITLIICVFVITGCSQSKMVGIPDGYIDKEEYYDQDDFQDYTDYAKYVYDTKDMITSSKEYKKIEQDDIQNIVGYFENFSGWMETVNRLNEFDFDINDINEGDYVKIKTKEGQKIANGKYEKYDNYSVYFFDIEKLTLYYIHNNI